MMSRPVTLNESVKVNDKKPISRGQSQPQAQPPTEPAAMRKGRKNKTGDQKSNQQRSQSSSPDKVRILRRQPSLRMPPYSHECRPTNSKIEGLENEYDSSVPPFARSAFGGTTTDKDIGDAFAYQLNQIQSHFAPPPLTFRTSHAQSTMWHEATTFSEGSPPDHIDPTEHPPGHVLERSSDSAFWTESALSSSPLASVCSTLSSDDEIRLPRYASLFRPRLPQSANFECWQSPIPDCNTVEHALFVRSSLTRFHIGVLLVDAEAGENERKRFEGLRSLIEQHMPGLKKCGIQRCQIVFYYHGRGETRVGSEVWSAIGEWEMNERERRSQRAYDCRKQDLKHQEQDVEQRGSPELGEVGRAQIRRPSKETQRWIDFAKHEETKNRVRGAYGHLRSWLGDR